MNSLIIHSQLLIKYVLLFGYFYLIGRSCLVLLSKYYLKKDELPKSILFIRAEIFYPIIGISLIGNILIILNLFLPIKSSINLIFLLLLLLPNLLITNFNLIEVSNFYRLFYYLIIPAILIISSYDTSWHYDAGYYHLNHQNWLRESNMILGTVNIFWAFGMSSVYEYISAILWIDKSFILIHFLTLIFIQTIYIFLIDNFRSSTYKDLKYVSFFLLIYSLIDNFGVNGGRNGFIYIQGVTKQDMPVGILIFIIVLSCLLIIKYKDINNADIFTLSLISLFVVQIKLSSVIIIYPLIIALVSIYKPKIKKNYKLLISALPSVFFGIVWLIKGYFTTGCFLFPLASTCINNFDWYVKNSTASFESVTTTASYSLIDYLYSSKSISEWWNYFYSFKINRTVILNFFISFLILYLVKKIFFSSEKQNKVLNFTLYSFILLNITYLILYGPTPRYAIGICLLSVGVLGISVSKPKFEINYNLFSVMAIFSVLLLVRVSSYQTFLSDPSIAIFNPVGLAKYEYRYDDWVLPDEGDQCWINLKCTMEKEEILFNKTGIFKVAYKPSLSQ